MKFRPKEKKKRQTTSLTLPLAFKERVQRMADREMRPLSNMLYILVVEALEVRENTNHNADEAEYASK